ncbi:alpha/beta hydrolase [Mycolicibacterium mengxianglii]|uniref:alpha/beta hydrolase n=1 Tax=Mycolicibacterium mengxianglii TaxID=2736649 RepID=UPI0018D05F1F|nr:alpha/beta fold hydrolase [Mycolicibacterium mengxianglii]
MPHFDTEHGRVYYRHWPASEPHAAVIFLHGFGENTALYHRYAFRLNAAGIDVWAVDQLGHGLSPGERGNFGTVDDSAALAESLTQLARQTTPDIPLVLQGHSFGAAVTLSILFGHPDRYVAAVISGAPLVPIRDLLDTDTNMELDLAALSADPFYLDALENDPLGFADADGAALARALDTIWDRLGAELPELDVPTLAVHGAADAIAPVGAVRAYAEQVDALELMEIPGGRHDILNETVHHEVAAAIIEFIGARTGTA